MIRLYEKEKRNNRLMERLPASSNSCVWGYINLIGFAVIPVKKGIWLNCKKSQKASFNFSLLMSNSLDKSKEFFDLSDFNN